MSNEKYIKQILKVMAEAELSNDPKERENALRIALDLVGKIHSDENRTEKDLKACEVILNHIRYLIGD